MTDPTPQPGAAPVLPSVSDLAARAYRLHCLIDALDLINDAGPLFREDATPHERRAINAMVPMMDMLREYSHALADDLEIVADAERRRAWQQDAALRQTLATFDATEQEALAEALEAHNAGKVTLDAALEGWRQRVEEHRAARAASPAQAE